MNVTLTVCPCTTCRTGPGMVPPNVHARYCTSLAICTVASVAIIVTATVLPLSINGGSAADARRTTGAADAILNGETAAAAFCGVGGAVFVALPRVLSANTSATTI